MHMMLTIRGLTAFDQTVWQEFRVPDGVDRQTAIDNICLELGELELLYPTPEAMRVAIHVWSRAEYDIWERLQQSTEFEYNPIDNYNRIKTVTDTETRNLASNETETRNLASGQTETRDLKTTETGKEIDSGKTTPSNNVTTTRYTYGYNSDTKNAAEETVTTPSSVVDTQSKREFEDRETGNSGTVTNSGTDTGTVGRAGTDTGTVTHTISTHTRGNIGVTTTTQMIDEYRQSSQFCVIDFITQSFKNRFCLMVY